MTARIEIAFAPAEGAVLRMLGLIERRGFALRGVVMSEAEGALRIEVEPRDACRRLDVIAAQLRRLVEVRTVITLEQDPSS